MCDTFLLLDSLDYLQLHARFCSLVCGPVVRMTYPAKVGWLLEGQHWELLEEFFQHLVLYYVGFPVFDLLSSSAELLVVN